MSPQMGRRRPMNFFLSTERFILARWRAEGWRARQGCGILSRGLAVCQQSPGALTTGGGGGCYTSRVPDEAWVWSGRGGIAEPLRVPSDSAVGDGGPLPSPPPEYRERGPESKCLVSRERINCSCNAANS